AGGRVAFSNQDNVSHSVAFDDGQVINLGVNETKFASFSQVQGVPFRSLRDPARLTGMVGVTEKSAFTDAQGESSALFEYRAFNGSRGFAFFFRTAQSGPVVLSHRSAFFTALETLRSPVEGVSKSASFDVRFGGTCTDEACVQLSFEHHGQKRAKLDLPLGDSARLDVRVLGLSSGGAVQVTAPAGVRMESGSAGTQKAVVSNDSAILAVPSGASNASFVFSGRRLSGDASLSVTVYASNVSVFDGAAPLRVVSKSAPALSVSFKPKSIQALEPTDVTVTLKDGFGEAVSGALVSVGSDQAQEQKPGEYLAAGVLSESLSPVSFSAKADGFKEFSGTLPVNAPDAVLDVSPDFVALSADSTEAETGTVTVTNLLS
ncbi:MAG: hypothetical protein Q8P02_03070, partial [Candidatus Micrarchaeota archaeon]|nr:hypothetical protein [Candidatus Micrarchaeota archaeon]